MPRSRSSSRRSRDDLRPEDRAARRKLLEVAKLPPTAPAHGPVVIDRNSTIWIQEYRAPFDKRPAGVAALDRTGQLLFRGVSPPHARLEAASPNAIVFVARDELDVETLGVYDVTCS